jgi:hypothetical protein
MGTPSDCVASGFGAMGWVLCAGWQSLGNRVEKMGIEGIVERLWSWRRKGRERTKGTKKASKTETKPPSPHFAQNAERRRQTSSLSSLRPRRIRARESIENLSFVICFAALGLCCFAFKSASGSGGGGARIATTMGSAAARRRAPGDGPAFAKARAGKHSCPHAQELITYPRGGKTDWGKKCRFLKIYFNHGLKRWTGFP